MNSIGEVASRPKGAPAFPLYAEAVRQYSARTAPAHAGPILQYLRKNGQRLDSEIAAATGIPIAAVRASISELCANGQLSLCTVTKFVGGKPVESFLCRLTGTIPPKTPGPKPVE